MSLDDFSKTTLLHAICTDYWLEATIIISSSRNYSEPHRFACVLQVSDAAFRLALVLDSFSPRNLDLMLLGWPGHPRRLQHSPPARTTSSAPCRNHGGSGCSASATLHSGEHLGFLLPCLCCTLWCVLVLFLFCSSPLVPYWKLWLVLCMIKFSLRRIAPLFASCCCYCTLFDCYSLDQI
jgi:hypothetical protein